MDLATFLRGVPIPDREAFAARCGTTHGHIRNVAFSGKPCGVELAVSIEQATAGAVRRQDLRPSDWHRIWPELKDAEGAPEVEPQQQAA